jgi:hypothetical protein
VYQANSSGIFLTRYAARPHEPLVNFLYMGLFLRFEKTKTTMLTYLKASLRLAWGPSIISWTEPQSHKGHEEAW